MSDTKTTALDLLRNEKINEALDLLEHLQESVVLRDGEPIPFDRLPIMPLNIELDHFAIAWSKATSQANAEQLERMMALTGWLASLKALPVAFMEVARLTAKCADLEADIEGTDIYIGVMADTLGVKRVGKDLSCVGHAIERLVKEREAAKVPEWRPLSVLTDEVKSRHVLWMVRGKPTAMKLPAVIDLSVKSVWEVFPRWIDLECRPVDSEGIPVPWAKVGL